MTEQSISDLTPWKYIDRKGKRVRVRALSQVQVNRIRLGDRKDPRASTWKVVNDAYLAWKADAALAQKAA